MFKFTTKRDPCPLGKPPGLVLSPENSSEGLSRPEILLELGSKMNRDFKIFPRLLPGLRIKFL